MISATDTSRKLESRGGRRANAGDKSKAEKSSDVYARYNEARAAREEANARIADMEARKIAGELVEVAAAAAAWDKVIAAFRAKALSLPQKAAPLVVGVESIAEIESVLKRAVYEMLTELASGADRT